MSRRERVYVTTRDFIIPAGTELKEWKGEYETVLGITKDSVAYFRMDAYDIDCSDGFAVIRAASNNCFNLTQ